LITVGVSARSVVKPLVDDAITTILITCPGASMLFYRAALPLSAQTLSYVAGIIRRHRAKIGSCWRRLNPGRQALLVLVHLRKGEPFADLAAGFAVGTATAWRYARETITLLAARAPEAARRAGGGQTGWACVRGDRWHPHRDRPGRRGPAVLLRQAPPPRDEPAGHLQPAGGDSVGLRPAARRRPRPDRGPDLGHHPRAAGRRVNRAGRQGLHRCWQARPDPYRGRNKPASQKSANSAHAKLRAPGERANAQLKHWGILRKLRC
jgi:hypothetical protein